MPIIVKWVEEICSILVQRQFSGLLKRRDLFGRSIDDGLPGTVASRAFGATALYAACTAPSR
jgi:hypothetical protein